MSGTVQFFPGEDGQFYFRVRAANGEIVSVSEGYSSLSNARRGHTALLRAVLQAAPPEVIDPGQGWEDDLLGKTPKLIAGPDPKVSPAMELQEDLRATRTPEPPD